MKKTKSFKKLFLNKKTVTNLDFLLLKTIKGGCTCEHDTCRTECDTCVTDCGTCIDTCLNCPTLINCPTQNIYACPPLDTLDC